MGNNISSSGNADFIYYCCCKSLNSGKWFFFLGEERFFIINTLWVCPAGRPFASSMIRVFPSAAYCSKILSTLKFPMRHIDWAGATKVWLAEHKRSHQTAYGNAFLAFYSILCKFHRRRSNQPGSPAAVLAHEGRRPTLNKYFPPSLVVCFRFPAPPPLMN